MKIKRIIIIILAIFISLSFSACAKKESNINNGLDNKKQEKKPSSIVKEDLLFFKNIENLEDPLSNKLILIKIDPDKPIEGETIKEFIGNFNIFNYTNKKNNILFSKDNNKLIHFDLENNKEKQLIEIENSRSIDDAMFYDKDKIAFISSDTESQASATNSKLEIYNLSNEDHYSIFLNEKSPIFASFSILYFDQKQNSLFLKEAGGDAGFLWINIYKVNLSSNNLEQVRSLELEFDPVTGQEKALKENQEYGVFYLNDSYSKAATIKDSVKYNNENVNIEGDKAGCLKEENFNDDVGKELLIKDEKTNNVEKIFKNSDFKNNQCKNLLRNINSVYWLDEKNIIVQDPAGIYSLDIDSKEKRIVYEYKEKENIKEIYKPVIVYASKNYIIFNNDSVLDILDKKIVDLSTYEQAGDNSSIIFEYLDFSNNQRRIN